MNEKVKLYKYVAQYLDSPTSISWEHKSADFRHDGTVWRGKKRIGFWYALVGQGHTSGGCLVVRRDRLRDLERIEALRWKLIQRLSGVVWERRAKAIKRANELGRIWFHDEFYYADDGSQPNTRREPKSDDVIGQLALIPTPDEEEAGHEYSAADDWLRDYWRRIGKIGEILRAAMRIHPDAPKQEVTLPRQLRATRVSFKLNGRLYVNYKPNSWGAQVMEIWPDPSDEDISIPRVKETFRACSVCGLTHNRKVRTCLHCPMNTPPTRETKRRGGLLRNDKHRRRLD